MEEAETPPVLVRRSIRDELLVDEDVRMLEAKANRLMLASSSGDEADEDEVDTDEDVEQEDEEKCFNLLLPSKMRIGQPQQQQQAKSGRSNGSAEISLTGMAFSASVDALLVTTKMTGTDGQESYAVTQLHPTAAGANLAAAQRHQQRRTRYYQPVGLEHRGQLGLASCGRDAPGQLVCSGAGARLHGVFLLQALPGAGNQPLLARCCGPPGSRLGEFNRPGGCAVDGGNAWVADQLNHRVQRLALPTLAPLSELKNPRLFRPSHVTVLADAHYAVRLLLVAHERGVMVFDLLADPQPDGSAPRDPLSEFAKSRFPMRRWGGLCVHWGAVLLADQAANCVRVYRYVPVPGAAGSFSLVQRVSLAPLGLCLPRHLATHRWLDLLYVAAHDTRENGGELCLLTVQMVRVQPPASADEAKE